MNPLRAAAWAARLIGLLTLGWIYLAWFDLRWLLHLHAVHVRLLKTPFDFSYTPYLACSILNVGTSIAAAATLLFFPSALLRALTPARGSTSSRRPPSPSLFTAGVAIGLILLVLGLYTILSTTLWTIYNSGHNAGWQMDLSISVIVAIAGFILCRRVLTAQRANP